MLTIKFDKGYAEQVLNAISAKEPIPIPTHGWDEHGLLMLAGVAYASISSFEHFKKLVRLPDPLRGFNLETTEAMGEATMYDLHAGTEFFAILIFELMSGQYDIKYGPHVESEVSGTYEYVRIVKPIRGYKDQDGNEVV